MSRPAATRTRRIATREVTAVGGIRVPFDLSAFTCRVLAAELADEWVELSAAERWRVASVRNSRGSIESFCTFVDAHIPQAKTASLGTDGPQLARIVRAWTRQLPGLYAAGSRVPAGTAGHLKRLVARRAAYEQRPVSEELRAWADAPGSLRRGETKELDEFPRAEKRALVAAAWTDLRRVEARIRAGRELAARGQDPATGGWLALENILWAIVHGSALKEILGHLPPRRSWPEHLRALLPPEVPATGQVQELLRALVAQLYPATMDLHPLRVLLMSATNAAAEEVTALDEDDVEFQPSGVLLTLGKMRARRISRAAFGDDEADDGEVLVPAGSPRLDAAQLIRRFQWLTAPLAERTGLDPAPLFLRASVNNQVLVIKEFDPNQPHRDLRAWATRCAVHLSEPVDIRRLRKSGKVEKAIALRGRVSDIADDHSVAVFRKHYAHGTTLHVIAGNVITSAQQYWLDKALAPTGPVLLDQAAHDSLAEPGAEAALGLTREQVEELRSGAMDMGVTGCRDPEDSPFGRPGQLCPVAPLRCLECKNAFILPSNLPQLLLFAEHLDRLTLRLSPAHFERLWATSRTNLQAALDARTDAELAAARRQITEEQLRLQLPLASHVEFDA